MRQTIKRPHFGLTILATSLGFALVQLDVSVINVALARMGMDLHTGVAALQWVVDAYALAFACLLLSAGALGDQIGARKTFIAGLLLFIAASAGCGLAPNAAALIAARVVQGIGAASLVPCSLSLINHAFHHDPGKRARAISLWTAAGGIGLSAGPVLGGALTDAFGWRSIFLINLPVGLAGVGLACRFLEESASHRTRFDLAGQLLAILSLGFLTGAIIEAGSLGWSAPVVLGALTLGLFLGVCFVFAERRVPVPMLPLTFFSSPTFSAATAVGLLINLTLYGMIFVFGLYLQQVRRFSPTWAGVAFLPFSVTLTLANVINGWLSRVWEARRLMVIGTVLGALGFGLLHGLSTTSAYATMLPGLLILPLGIGLAVPAMTASLLGTVPKGRSGVASGVLNTVRQSGGAVGVALYGAFLAGAGVDGIGTAFALSSALLLLAALVAALGISERDACPRVPVPGDGCRGSASNS
ncbi:MAG: MFS transporter [Verrucomicrobia bacterium]|nr:MFS transporter [Verrucomicrobiota bacterium]